MLYGKIDWKEKAMNKKAAKCKNCGLFIPLDNDYYDGFCGAAHISFMYNKIQYIKSADKQSCGYFELPIKIKMKQTP